MSTRARSGWTRSQLLVAFALYCRIPFSRLHARNPEVIEVADAIGRTPSALAMKLVNIASLDPEITTTGRSGLRNASANDREMWDHMQNGWAEFAAESYLAMSEFGVSDESLDGTVQRDGNGDRVGEDRAVNTTVRVGQDFFRAAVLSAYSGQCCITGLSVPKLLIASHIVPWRVDKHNRVNPRNGLLLSALHDRAFDAGLITVGDDLTVRVSPKYSAQNDKFFLSSIGDYDGLPIRLPTKFRPAGEFLAYHRRHVFQR